MQALASVRQENQQFEDSLCYIARPHFIKINNKIKRKVQRKENWSKATGLKEAI
jgi:hypothetical protein